jgi:hypothetical protein
MQYARRCAYPRCVAEASTRCGACRRVYCTVHCSTLSLGSGGRNYQCDPCLQQGPPAAGERRTPRGPAAALAAVVVLLLLVRWGITLDVSTGGHLIIAFVTFTGAFVAFVLFVDG